MPRGITQRREMSVRARLPCKGFHSFSGVRKNECTELWPAPSHCMDKREMRHSDRICLAPPAPSGSATQAGEEPSLCKGSWASESSPHPRPLAPTSGPYTLPKARNVSKHLSLQPLLFCQLRKETSRLCRRLQESLVVFRVFFNFYFWK